MRLLAALRLQMPMNSKVMSKTFTKWRFSKLMESISSGPNIVPLALLLINYVNSVHNYMPSNLAGDPLHFFGTLIDTILIPVMLMGALHEITRREMISLEKSEWLFGNVVLGVLPCLRHTFLVIYMAYDSETDHSPQFLSMMFFPLALSTVMQQSWRHMVLYQPMQMLIVMCGWWYSTAPNSATSADLQTLALYMWLALMAVVYQNEQSQKEAFQTSFGIVGTVSHELRSPIGI